MPSDSGWSADWSYSYFVRLLKAAKSTFRPHLIREAPGVLRACGPPKLFLRHDVDVSLERAHRIAEIEAQFDVRATFMVMTNSELYQLNQSKPILNELCKMGHEIALHFDLSEESRREHTSLDLTNGHILAARNKLEDIIGAPCRSVSFHRPIQWVLRGPLMVCGMVNAYSAELMDWYLSDSKGGWRQGDPLPQLSQTGKSLLQLLIHPIWWGESHLSPQDRLEEFFQAATTRMASDKAKAFDHSLAATVPAVLRAGYPVRGKE